MGKGKSEAVQQITKAERALIQSHRMHGHNYAGNTEYSIKMPMKVIHLHQEENSPF